MDAFVDRDAELRRLTDCYESTAAELAVVYGRRRLGKTELVKQSIADRDGVVFYQAREKTKTLQLDQFASAAAETYPGVERIQQEWEPLLGYLAEQDAIVVLDEFPYLIAGDESLPSVLQAMFDHEIADSAATFVLVGSSISMMEEAALLGNSPLYGRATVTLDVNQLSFSAAMELLGEPDDPTEQIRYWGVFGGTPYYLEACLLPIIQREREKLTQAGDGRKESVRNQSLRQVCRKSCRDASLRPRGQTGGLGLAE